MTQIHYASKNGHMVVFKDSANHLENKNPADNGGMTPLHAAAEYGHMEIFKYIAENLENKNPFDENRITPVALACDKKHYEIITYLEEHADTLYHKHYGCSRLESEKPVQAPNRVYRCCLATPKRP